MRILQDKKRVIYLSILAAIATLGIKFTAYYLTNSVGLLGDALESGVNLVAAIFATAVLAYASRPPDATHTYGHDKAEYFSSGVEGTLILLAAAGIVFSATKRLLNPAPLENLSIGLTVAVSASLVNFAVARLLLKAAKLHDSIVLEADAKHLLTDVWTSVGVVTGVLVVGMTDLTILDPLIAYVVAANIMLSGGNLLKRSFKGLMDYSLPASEVKSIENILRSHSETVFEYHNLRTRKSGPNRFIDFHILVPGDFTVQAAHDLCEKIEREIESKLKNTHVTIHVEPIEDQASWDGV